MPLTEHARRYLIAEGIKPETIIKIGSCMQEVLSFYKPKIKKSKILDKLKIKDNEYFLVSTHREENVDRPDRMKMLIDTLNKIASKYKKTIVFSVHPRTKERLSRLKGLKINKDIKFIKALGFLDFIKLQQHAKCVLSDSGTISEESSLLGLKSIMLRQAHERPEAMDEAVTIMSDLDEKSVLNAIEIVLKQGNNLNSVVDYEGGKVSQKVIRTILSYTSYVNRTVWKSS
jgi:UDP-N-acetylglucosamine 2-epimerase (non-hydrolysing)